VTGGAQETLKYKRIVLKLSGEALAGPAGYGLDPAVLTSIATQIGEIHEQGVQIAVVIGGGNLFRGVQAAAHQMDETTGDYLGMLATVMNALALQSALERMGRFTRVQSALQIQSLAEPYIRRRAIRHLEKGRIVIFAAGTGNPHFTTDTAAAVRAMEIGADVVLKATQVDGIYTADPKHDRDATKLAEVGYMEILTKRLKVMDATAVSFCMEHEIPIVVFNMSTPGNLRRIVAGEAIGTFVR